MQEIKTISVYKQGLKERILEVAMQAFVERGIRAVKMDDIAARLSISKRTLYEIYDNKEDLLFEGAKAYHERVTKHLQQIASESADVMEVILQVYRIKVDEFRQTSPTFYADIVKYPRILNYLKEENKRLQGSHREFLERGVKEGFFRRDVNYEMVGILFDALGKYVMSNELYRRYSIEEIFSNLVFVSLRGMCTEKGVKELDKFI